MERCPFCNGRIMFRPCPCLQASVAFGALDFTDARRMRAEMGVFFVTREPLAGAAANWVPSGHEGAPSTESPLVPWSRRLLPDAGALALPFTGWGKEPAQWYAVLYLGGRIIEDCWFLSTEQDNSPSSAIHWAETRLALPTAWDRL